MPNGIGASMQILRSIRSDFERLAKLDGAGSFFVTRAKSNMKARRRITEYLRLTIEELAATNALECIANFREQNPRVNA